MDGERSVNRRPDGFRTTIFADDHEREAVKKA
jgi:hypothetical protein